MAPEDEEIRPDSEDDGEGGPIKSFLDHLEDLRWVFIKCGVAIVVGMIGCLAAAPQIVEILKWPLIRSGVKANLENFGPTTGIMISMRLAFYVGLVIGLPFILFFIGEFVIPALKKKERKYFLSAFFIGTGFFLLGVVLCYFYVLPISLKGLDQFNTWLKIPTVTWRADEYFAFVTKFLLSVGLLLELPVLILALVRLGVIKHSLLAKGRRYMFVINLVFVAVITPADPATTLVMAVVLQLMFEGCIMISSHWERQRIRQEPKD